MRGGSRVGAGRPKQTEPNYNNRKMVSIRLSLETIEKLAKLSKRYNLSKTEIIENLIKGV